MSLVKKALKGAAVVAGIGACALLIKKVVKGPADGYYNLDECEDDNYYDESGDSTEEPVLEEAQNSEEEIVTEEDITENEITEEDSLEEDTSLDADIESDVIENNVSEEDKSSNPLEDEK